MRSFDIGDCVFRDFSLLVARAEDGGAVAGASIVALAIEGCRVANLE